MLEPSHLLLPLSEILFRPALAGHTLKQTSVIPIKIAICHPPPFLALLNLYLYHIMYLCAYFISPPVEYDLYKDKGMVCLVYIYIPSIWHLLYTQQT